MKIETNIHDTNHDCISQAEMIAYIQGKLSATDMHRVERHLLDCEMCNDEFEGLQLLENPETIHAISQELNNKIVESITTEKIIPFSIKRTLLIAASIIVVFGIGFMSYFMLNTSKEIVQIAENKIQPKVIADTNIIQPSNQKIEENIPIASPIYTKKGFVIDSSLLIVIPPTNIASAPSVDTPSFIKPTEMYFSPNIEIAQKSNNQGFSIHGKIIDKKTNEPLIGCSVAIRNSTYGTFTNVDGSYDLHLNPGTYEVEISYVGYKTVVQKITVEKNETIAFNPEMIQDTRAIESVVKIGYASVKSEDATGANTIAQNDISKAPVLGVDQALQGKAAGVQVRSNSGSPGSGMDIVVRGVGSAGDARPLYVVDGVPQGYEWKGDPNQIESLTILKDASSCAIYGARGANGVILITTKGGNAYDGNSSSNFNSATYAYGSTSDFARNIKKSIVNSIKVSDQNKVVVVYCRINSKGNVSVAQIDVKNQPDLQEKIIDLIESDGNWKPATNNGIPTNSSIIVTIDFSN